MEAKGLSKAAKMIAAIVGITIISRILGLIRDILMGSYFGATTQTDAYIVSNSIPGILFSIVASAIATSFIPVYSKIDLHKGREESNSYTNRILNVVLFVSIILCVLGILFSKWITYFTAIGFDADTLKLTEKMTRIIFPTIIFVGIVKIQSAYLQANGRVVIPTVLSIPSNIFLIIALLLSGYIGIEGLAWFTVLGALFQVIFQIPFTKKEGFKYKFLISLNDKDVRYTGILVAPIFAGTAIQQVSTIIDRMLASGLKEGSISALNYADKMSSFMLGILTLAVATVIFPVLSSLSASKDTGLFKSTIVYSVNIIVIFTIPAVIGVLILNKPIIQIFFERGAFDPGATSMTASALVFYSIGMLAFSIRDILSRTFYSLHDTKTPMINAVILLIINIILNLILIRPMAHAGLALATSTSAIITLPMLFISLKKKIGCIGGKSMLVSAGKSLVAAVFMGIWVFILNKLMVKISGSSHAAQIIQLVFCLAAGVGIYMSTAYFLKIKELVRIVSGAKEKIKNISNLFKNSEVKSPVESNIKNLHDDNGKKEYKEISVDLTSNFRAYEVIKHEEVVLEELNSFGKLLNVKVKLRNVQNNPIKLAVIVFDNDRNVKGIQFATVLPEEINKQNELVDHSFSFILDGNLYEEKKYDIKVIAHYLINH